MMKSFLIASHYIFALRNGQYEDYFFSFEQGRQYNSRNNKRTRRVAVAAAQQPSTRQISGGVVVALEDRVRHGEDRMKEK